MLFQSPLQEQQKPLTTYLKQSKDWKTSGENLG